MKKDFTHSLKAYEKGHYRKERDMEFHVCKSIRDTCHFNEELFATNGNVILANFKNVRIFTQKINETIDTVLHPEKTIKAGQLNAMGLLDEIFHIVCNLYREKENESVFEEALCYLEEKCGKEKVAAMLFEFTKEFPGSAIYKGDMDEKTYLEGKTKGISNKVISLEEIMLLHLANENPALEPFLVLFGDENLSKNKMWSRSWAILQEFFKKQPLFGPKYNDLITMLREPVMASPNSLKGQLDYIRTHWVSLLGEWLKRLLAGLDMIAEEEKPGWDGNFSGPPPMEAYNYDSLMNEYERFSPDREWMPNVILMAKTVLVWLDQLSKKYKKEITTLDQIPDEELDNLAQAGFTGLWLIGLWERSWASKRIKQKCGNPEAAASAYSLHDYEIAENLGGWQALDNLRKRLWFRGIRLASDMVPNHTGMDAKWIAEKPDLFMQSRECPFPSYSFNGENLSLDPRITIQLEDRYYSKEDCAVVFKRIDNTTGDTRYIYHGNDGTGMPWNDTAQIDFLNPEAREEVIQEILHVAKNFPIIRFDAAMVLAKKHIRRLWYPEPGCGGDIASRAEHAISRDDFEKAIPAEFWRDVVDRVAKELPDTLLLAEAFWMMEGYFVRTLGMHRVYNSAFMNMLMKEENFKYRSTVKNTIEFDPQILKRYVNFMNNPDEDTAVHQFGKGDKYFGVCTLMITMPGLPMFGHGQVEGFAEKYGMEFTKAYWDEKEDYGLIEQHKKVIFPLMKKRYLFAGVENFCFYDFWDNGSVNENVFAYSNSYGNEKAIVFYNNKYEQTAGWIKDSCKFAQKKEDGSVTEKNQSIANALELTNTSDKYVIFQEQKSGLWFIRNSAQVHEQGLFASLNGFEYQVLWNVTEVSDDSTGMYKILCDSLDGKGVQNIDVALKEIFLHDLYASLEKFANPEFFEDIHEICIPSGKKESKKKTRKTATALKNIKEAGIEYFDMLETFIQGNYGSSKVLDRKNTGEKMGSEFAWKKFEARVKKLTTICIHGKTKEAHNLEKDLYAWILKTPTMVEILVSAIMLHSLRDIIGEKATAEDTENLLNLWCLDRKMRDILIQCGLASKNTYEIFKVMLSVVPFCDCKLHVNKLEEASYVLAKKLVTNDLAPLVIGLNNFNNTLWFNKEKTDFAFEMARTLYTLFTAKPSDYEKLEDTLKIVYRARDESEYKVEDFVGALKPIVKKPRKKVQKKTTPKK